MKGLNSGAHWGWAYLWEKTLGLEEGAAGTQGRSLLGEEGPKQP